MSGTTPEPNADKADSAPRRKPTREEPEPLTLSDKGHGAETDQAAERIATDEKRRAASAA